MFEIIGKRLLDTRAGHYLCIVRNYLHSDF